MRTKRCYGCGRVKRAELFDIDRHRGDGRSSRCKACRRQRQNRGGYAACRNRALWKLAACYPDEYRRYRQQARLELAPDTAPVQVWDQARGRALAELSRRHRGEWHQRYQQLRAAHPTWTQARAFSVATAQQRRAHRDEFLELLTGYAGAQLAGPKLVARLIRRAQRRLQLAHLEEFQALYAAERAHSGNPVRRVDAGRSAAPSLTSRKGTAHPHPILLRAGASGPTAADVPPVSAPQMGGLRTGLPPGTGSAPTQGDPDEQSTSRASGCATTR